jgi:hypothetical protein
MITATAEAQMMTWDGNGFVSANIGVQTSGDEIGVDARRDLFGEQLTVGSAAEIGGGSLWDFAAGYRVWRNLVVGVGYSFFANDTDTTATLSVPNPLVTDAPRTGNVTAGLEHSQRALHFSASWMIPVTDKIDTAISFGPSIFFVRQDLVTDVAFSEVGFPFTSINVQGPVVTEIDETGSGFHVGADVTYRVADRIGVGGFLRYAAGGVDAPATTAGEIDAGGVQIGFGLRYRF